MAEAAVAYVLAQPAVGAAVVGLSRRALVVDGRRVRLGRSDIERLEAAVPKDRPGRRVRSRARPQGPRMRASCVTI